MNKKLLKAASRERTSLRNRYPGIVFGPNIIDPEKGFGFWANSSERGSMDWFVIV